ncbi:unnamed protein product, partial [Mesorhabditis belari]|uniref:Uncharacterized protein n=1 Tax=Mesorhabditis belari TaxID=2138241 RepID=A0AAF3ETC2_9BILA
MFIGKDGPWWARMDAEEVMQNILLQTCLALAMFITTAVAGFLPIKILRMLTKKDGSQSQSGARWLSLLSCFSGGVFMATCFLDIMPHINENYATFLSVTKWDPDLPIPQFFICIGFFVVYLIEEACIKIFSMGQNGHGLPPGGHHGHSHGNGVAFHAEDLPPAIEEQTKPSMGKPLKARDRHRISESSNANVMTDEKDEMLLEKGFEREKDQASATRRSYHSLHDLVMEESVKYVSADGQETSFLKSLTFAVAMSFHSILEGFALGVQDTPKRIFTLFLSLILHKGIEAFSVGLQISKANTKRVKVVVCTILIYALMTPIGSALGTWLETSDIDPLHKEGAIVILESLAAGTFIYVTFLEVLASEKENEHDSLKQLLAIFIGFVVITALQFAFGGHGAHTGAHEHEHSTTTTMVPGH